MALFTDGQLNGILDLQNYENRILDVASAEAIDLAGKIALAQGEIANELIIFLLKRWHVVEYAWLPQPVIRHKIGVSDVVVTNPLRQWHAYKTLAFVYRDAYNNQLNDRYQGKWYEYEELAKASSRNYYKVGVGIVATPVPKGSVPLLSAIAGNGVPGTYYVALTWVDRLGQAGSASDVAQMTTVAGQQMVVASANAPGNAIGWNVYVGATPDSLMKQNDAPVNIGSTWVILGSINQGVAPGDGQQPNWYVIDHQTIERG